MDEITRLVVMLCEKIDKLGLGNYLEMPEKDKQDLNKLYSELKNFLA